MPRTTLKQYPHTPYPSTPSSSKSQTKFDVLVLFVVCYLVMTPMASCIFIFIGNKSPFHLFKKIKIKIQE